MKRLVIICLTLTIFALSAKGQSAIVKEFKPACDSLAVLIKERNAIKGKLELKAVMKRGSTLDFYFTESLGDYPWRTEDYHWFKKQLRQLFPENYSSYKLGEIYSRKVAYDKLITPEIGFDGTPVQSRHKVDNPKRTNIVTELNGTKFSQGLSGRHIALWQSHGYYYNHNEDRWMWQRPCLFQTVEDMFTQSFVLPYLAPMLENAGAYTLIPRERDVQHNEVIADNDSTDIRYGIATYTEKGKWVNSGKGFAAKKASYTGTENPFDTGSARQIEVVQNGKRSKASVQWRPEIPERGEYAVYISYKTLPKSTTSAHYRVHHLGGVSDFVVNQKMGGGTWIYLGTFEFDKGSNGYVSLTNETPEGYKYIAGNIVTADAVRFGGGIGNSGMPRSAEAARYYLQWAGVSPDIYSQNEEENDYKDDFMSRGDWVEWISRGSAMNPKKTGLSIPVDLSFGFHTDAGTFPNDSLVGTLAIYTLNSDGSQKLPNGESRMTSRTYADYVQTQIVHDLREQYDSLWNRRLLWDRGYRESRTPSAPAMLLELLSHQNFADMKYGLDPSFRFTVSRAVYKGMLKYLSSRYNVPYTVQPLPVGSVGVNFANGDKAEISWKATYDELEPTAAPQGYILYTRVDDGGFDKGIIISDIRKSGEKISTEITIEAGRIYSFKIAAYNEGGVSFPSETVSIGKPKKADNSKTMLIVNNFDRISGPAFFDTPTYAGFNNNLDSGVPHIRDIAYTGQMHEFRRDFAYISNDSPGFGASYSDYAGNTVAGNTFDIPYQHGKALMKAGVPFYSCSNETFSNDSTFRASAWSVDIVCGKQVTTKVGNGKQQKYEVFPAAMRNAIQANTAAGGNVLISGSYIGTDAWNQIYPIQIDSLERAETQKFIKNVLGYRWAATNASRSGKVNMETGSAKICNQINPYKYSVESPDGIKPSSANGKTIMRYADSGISAGVMHEGKNYKTVCLGFPIEALEDEDKIEYIITITLDFFNK